MNRTVKKNNGARSIPGISLVLVAAGPAGRRPARRRLRRRDHHDHRCRRHRHHAGTGTSVAAPTGDPIVIGAIVSATGPGAALGEQERNTLELMQEIINGKGGVLGRPIKIVVEDDKSDPKEAVTAVNKLLSSDKAVAIIAATTSSSTLAVKEICAAKSIPQMAMAAANDITGKPPIDWIWRTPQKDALAVQRALDYVSKTLKAKKIAVLHDENAFGSSGDAEIAKVAPRPRS